MAGLLSFQENIHIIVKQSLNLAKKKANHVGTLKFVITKDKESEDINYDLEWLHVMIQGTKAQEQEEYDESMRLYSTMKNHFKKDLPETNNNMLKKFKTKKLNGVKLEDAYKKGYGAMGDNNIANKLLEMGIITHIEWVHDYDDRIGEFQG